LCDHFAASDYQPAAPIALNALVNVSTMIVLSLLALTYHLGVGEPDFVFLTDPGGNEASGPRAATKPTSTLMPSQIGANLQVAAYSSEIAARSNSTHSKPFGDPSLLSQFRENQPAEESKPELAFSIPDRVHCLL
jgi:hypothetical protein